MLCVVINERTLWGAVHFNAYRLRECKAHTSESCLQEEGRELN